MYLNKKHLTIVFVVINIGILIHSVIVRTKFVYDGILILLLLFVLHKYYEKLHFTNLTYTLINIFILFHHLGSFFYGKSFFGREYDVYVHLFYGIIMSICVYSFLSKRFSVNKHKLDKLELFYTTIIIVMGISAVHELFEFSGSLLLGPGDGFLYFGSGDTGTFDTEWDLANGFLGSFFGCLLMSLIHKFKKDK